MILCPEHGFSQHVYNIFFSKQDENVIYLIHFLHLYIIHVAIIVSFFEFIMQSDTTLISLNTNVIYNIITL